MFSQKTKILNNYLKYYSSISPGTKWWLCKSDYSKIGTSITSIIEKISKGQDLPNVEVLKKNRNKIVFRYTTPDECLPSVIVKVFYIDTFIRRLKYHKYGLDEAVNLLIARDKGVNTPEVYGYGKICDILGMEKISIILLEDLMGFSTIGKLFEISNENQWNKIFYKTESLFVDLYNAGCNHIDVNLGSVMMSDNAANDEVFLLDFQHARFYDVPSLEVLMFETGYFAKGCSNWIPKEIVDLWLENILKKVGIDAIDQKRKLKERSEYYFQATDAYREGGRLSRKHRKKIC